MNKDEFELWLERARLVKRYARQNGLLRQFHTYWCLSHSFYMACVEYECRELQIGRGDQYDWFMNIPILSAPAKGCHFELEVWRNCVPSKITASENGLFFVSKDEILAIGMFL